MTEQLQYYRYVGKKDGVPCCGKIQAETPDEAKERLSRMGIEFVAFGDGDAKIQPAKPAVPASFPPPPAPPFPPPQSFMAPLVKGADGDPGLSQPARASVMKTIEILSKPLDREQDHPIARRQTFLVGEPALLDAQVEKYLAKMNGVVVHLVMHPDTQGKLKVAMVIEHDMEVKHGKSS
jgi:hypothetical protein